MKNNRAIIHLCHNTVNTSITGLLPDTTYTCCVLAVTSYGESESVCKSITIANDESKFYDIIKYCVSLCHVLTGIVLVILHLLLLPYHELIVYLFVWLSMAIMLNLIVIMK